MKASSPALMSRTERPPRLVLRFAVYTGCVLLLAGLAMLFILERDITSGAEQRVESQSRAVAEATFKQHLTRMDFGRPVSAKRRAKLDMVFQDRVFLAGVVQATLYDDDRRCHVLDEPFPDRKDEAERHARVRAERPAGPLCPDTGHCRRAHEGSPHDGPGSYRQRDGADRGALDLAGLPDDRPRDPRGVPARCRHPRPGAPRSLDLADPAASATTNQLRARNQQLADQARDVAQLAAIVEASDDAITRTSSDGTVVNWNPGAERLFGWRANEIVGRKLAVVVPSDRLDELSSVARKIEADRASRITRRARCARTEPRSTSR